jgi:hypothetical protein
MQSKLTGEIISLLYRYLDLINWKKQLFEKMVNDMEEVEALSEYQQLLGDRTDLYILIQDMEKLMNKEVYYGEK